MVRTPGARLPHMPLEEQQWRLLHAPPRARGRSEHGVCSYEEGCIPALMHVVRRPMGEGGWQSMSTMGSHQKCCRAG
jgi:hypothetical protein